MQTKQFVHSQFAYKDLLNSVIQPGSRWLDLGCGHTIVADWIKDSVPFQKELIARCEVALGCDPSDDRPHDAGLEKYVGSCDTLPYPDGFFNLVTANMVVEHISDPALFLREVRRVLSPGGKFVFHTPNYYYVPIFMASLLPGSVVRSVAKLLDGRESDDVFPTHYRMNTRRDLAKLPGFKVVDLRCIETAPVLGKVPIANLAESLLIRCARHPRLNHLQADWLAILERRSN
jgi:SAM-dependent methyltransferase